MNRRSSLRGSAFVYAPLTVTAGSSPSLQTKISDPIPELSHFITNLKSESDLVEMKDDPQSEDAVSVDEEDQLSDADQPCEDLIPLSKDQVPLTNAQDPLTEVKVEKPEVTVDETKIKVEEVEVTGPELQVTGSGVPTVQVPLRHRQVLRSANDNADLICTQSQQIAKLSARCNHTQRQLNKMVQLLRRRDNTISCLRSERDELASYIARRGGTVGGTGGGRIQIQSVNNTVEEKKPNRKLFIIKRARKSFVKTQPTTSVSVKRTSQILQNTSENGQKTSVLKRTFDIRENSDTGVKRSLNIVERSSLGIQDKSSTLNKSSVDVRRTSKIKSPVGLKQTSNNPSIAVKPISDIVKSPTLVIQPKSDNRKVSSVGVQRKSVNRQKPTITVKPMSEIIKSPSLVVQPKSDNRQMSSVRVQRTSVIRRKPSITIKSISEIIESPSLVVQPLSDNRQISSVSVQSLSENRETSKPDVRQKSVGLQRTSDIRQNALVIQIDGMHKTVLQPTLVRLDAYTEMG